MNGVFIKDKFGAVMLILSVPIAVIPFFIKALDPAAGNDVFLMLAIAALPFSIGLFFSRFNHKAYFIVNEERISARCGWRKKLDLATVDIVFVSPGMYTLTLLTRDGKRHDILGIANSWAICRYIREQNYSTEEESPVKLHKEYTAVKSLRKKSLIPCILCIVSMFLLIGIIVFLTGGKDPTEFNLRENILFICFAALELLACGMSFFFAVKCGRFLLPMQQLEYRLRASIISHQPLPPGNAKSIYTDSDHSIRVIIFHFPNDDGIHYCVQKFTGKFFLETVYRSEILEPDEEMIDEESFIPISFDYIEDIYA